MDNVTDNEDGDDDGPLVALDDANNAELEMDLEMHDESINEHNDENVHEDDEDEKTHDDINANEEEEVTNADAEDEDDEGGTQLTSTLKWMLPMALALASTTCELESRATTDIFTLPSNQQYSLSTAYGRVSRCSGKPASMPSEKN